MCAIYIYIYNNIYLTQTKNLAFIQVKYIEGIHRAFHCPTLMSFSKHNLVHNVYSLISVLMMPMGWQHVVLFNRMFLWTMW